jgi:hypothetical protein
MKKLGMSISIFLFFIFLAPIYMTHSQEEKPVEKRGLAYSCGVHNDEEKILIRFDNKYEPRLEIKKILKDGIEWYMMPDM